MPDPSTKLAQTLNDFVNSKLDEFKKIIRAEIANMRIASSQLEPGAVISPKIPDNAVTPRTINIPLLFADEATINQLKVATVGSLVAGTTVTIDEETFNINFDSTSGTFSITIGGTEEGEQITRIDRDGGYYKALSVRDRIDCDMIAWRYEGEDSFTEVTSLVDILDALNYCYLDKDLTITFATGLETIGESLYFVGIHGPGTITVYGSETSAAAGVHIKDCTCDITFHELYAAYTETRSPYVHYIDCSATGDYTASGTDTSVGSPTRTKLSGSSWKSDTDYFWQGYTSGTGRQYGAVWTPGLTEYATANILSASIRLKRVSGIGKGDAVDVIAYAVTNTSPSGDFITAGKVNCGTLGAINNGEVKTFAIPPAAAAVLCAGGCLVLDPGNTSVMSGKIYSADYAKFYGVGTGFAPLLTIAYEQEGETVTKTSTFEHNNMNDPDWTLLTPANGATADSSIGNGKLRYRIIGKHVFITGGVTIAWNGTSKAICSLPVAPAYANQCFIKGCSGTAIARVTINKASSVLELEWVKSLVDGSNVNFNSWVDCQVDYWID